MIYNVNIEFFGAVEFLNSYNTLINVYCIFTKSVINIV